MSKRIHGGKTLDKRIIDLHNEGWRPANIASIAQTDINTVREVLNRHHLFID